MIRNLATDESLNSAMLKTNGFAVTSEWPESWWTFVFLLFNLIVHYTTNTRFVNLSFWSGQPLFQINRTDSEKPQLFGVFTFIFQTTGLLLIIHSSDMKVTFQNRISSFALPDTSAHSSHLSRRKIEAVTWEILWHPQIVIISSFHSLISNAFQ